MKQKQNNNLERIESLSKLVDDDEIKESIELIFKSYSDENNLDELSEEAKTQLEKDMYILNWMFKSNKNSNINYDHWKNRINNLSALYEAGDKLYTLSVYDIVFNIVKKIYESKKDNEKIKNYYYETIKLGEELYKYNFHLQQNEVERPSIRKDLLHKLDGMDVLRSKLGDKEFIKLAIEGSFFFSKDLVKVSTGELNNEFEKSIKEGEIINNTTLEVEKYLNNKCKSTLDCINGFIGNKIKEISSEEKDSLEKVNKFINSLTKKNLETFLNEELSNKDEKVKQLNKYKAELVNKLDYLKARHTINNKIVQASGKLSEGDKGVYTIKDSTTQNREFKFRVHIDIDGNRFVRNLINNKTGIIVSQGKSSILQNTIISHVWGRAYDPRYFTSLWNIVLIPAWANSLMDKEDSPAETLASKMRATYMKICSELYNDVFESPRQEDNSGETIFGNYLTNLPAIENPDDVIEETYNFNVIKEKKGDNIVIDRQESFKITKITEQL